MRAANHLVLPDPVCRERAEVAQGLHGALRVEDVVDHPLEVGRVVGERHDVRVEDRGQLKRYDKGVINYSS